MQDVNLAKIKANIAKALSIETVGDVVLLGKCPDIEAGDSKHTCVCGHNGCKAWYAYEQSVGPEKMFKVLTTCRGYLRGRREHGPVPDGFTPGGPGNKHGSTAITSDYVNDTAEEYWSSRGIDIQSLHEYVPIKERTDTDVMIKELEIRTVYPRGYGGYQEVLERTRMHSPPSFNDQFRARYASNGYSSNGLAFDKKQWPRLCRTLFMTDQR